jgi:hypothetical protein
MQVFVLTERKGQPIHRFESRNPSELLLNVKLRQKVKRSSQLIQYKETIYAA